MDIVAIATITRNRASRARCGDTVIAGRLLCAIVMANVCAIMQIRRVRANARACPSAYVSVYNTDAYRYPHSTRRQTKKRVCRASLRLLTITPCSYPLGKNRRLYIPGVNGEPLSSEAALQQTMTIFIRRNFFRGRGNDEVHH